MHDNNKEQVNNNNAVSDEQATHTAVNPNPAANANIQEKIEELTPDEHDAATDNVGSEITDGEGG
ncbi:hypothetical protein I5907_14130 [Panacibacter sp. DH6]|uniref:Uncharacterized protein n=1 Tax=Panacibacter microcysteis TaxID=2793269 RepID=A0A931E2H8_9BACT|nr:hypothetical protein [Panacibacter microcysteis]MBG9377377.1 hypothetical protein [Panacibacter microcysteis]